MLWHSLLQLAKEIAAAAQDDDPDDVRLRCATCGAYYAAFHCLSQNCAETLAGAYPRDCDQTAWNRAYRSLGHSAIRGKTRRTDLMNPFAQDIKRFAIALVDLQANREDADYNPAATFSKAGVITDIRRAESAISAFNRLPANERRNFILYLFAPIR